MNKMSGVGITVLTVFSLASLSTDISGNSSTLNIINPNVFEASSLINDDIGELCLSSTLTQIVSGDIISENESMQEIDIARTEKKQVKLQVTKVTKHVSKFDFEEEYEEL